MFFLLLFMLFISLFASAQSDCPSNNSVEWNSKCYILFENQTQFANAALACKHMGAELASIHDEFTNSILNDFVSNNIHNIFKLSYWLGASKMFTGDWSWVDKTPFDFTMWDKDEPRNATWAKCAGVLVPNGHWTAFDCTNNRMYWCVTPSTKPTGCLN